MTDQEIADLCRRLADLCRRQADLCRRLADTLEDDVNGRKTLGWYEAVSKLATQLHTALGEALGEEPPS